MFSQYLWQTVQTTWWIKEKRKLKMNQLTPSHRLKLTSVPPRWSVSKWQYAESVQVKIVMSHWKSQRQRSITEKPPEAAEPKCRNMMSRGKGGDNDKQTRAKPRADTCTSLRTAWSITEWLQRDIKFKRNYFKKHFNFCFFSSLTDTTRTWLFLRIAEVFLGCEENKHNLTTGFSMIIWKTSMFSELLHTCGHVLKIILIVHPWFEWL